MADFNTLEIGISFRSSTKLSTCMRLTALCD